MLRFSIFGIPIRIEWFFWLSCVILGGGLYARGPEAWIKVLIWVIVAFISIMVHEMGHAFAARRFGHRVAISLHGLGGLTHFAGSPLTRFQSILVSLAGPGAGFALGFAAWMTLPMAQASIWTWIFWTDAVVINLFWTIFNLLPIMPLDGGQVMRDILGPARIQLARLIGAGVAAVAAILLAVYLHAYFASILMVLLAYINFRGIRQPGGVVRDSAS
jgi:stage IV sporulation protein FB